MQSAGSSARRRFAAAPLSPHVPASSEDEHGQAPRPRRRVRTTLLLELSLPLAGLVFFVLLAFGLLTS